MSSIRALRLSAAVVLAATASRGCFDSDEKLRAAEADDTTTGGPATTTGVDGTTDDGGDSTTADPSYKCDDVLQCTIGCVLTGSLENGGNPDLDLVLGCLFDCEPSCEVEPGCVGEALKTLRLVECATTSCVADGLCDILLPAGSSSDGGSSSGADEGSSSGDSGSSGSSTGDESTSSGDTSGSGSDSDSGDSGGSSSGMDGSSSSSTGPMIDPEVQCFNCLASILDPMIEEPPACMAEKAACLGL